MKRALIQFALSMLLLPVLPLWAQNECGSLQNLNALNAADTLGIVHKNTCWDPIAKTLTFPLASITATANAFASGISVPTAGTTFTPATGSLVRFTAPSNDQFNIQVPGTNGTSGITVGLGQASLFGTTAGGGVSLTGGGGGGVNVGDFLSALGDGSTNSAAVQAGSGTNIGYRDISAGVTTSNMAGQTTATCTNVTGMTWPVLANANYRLSCMVHASFAAAATIQFCIGGPGTPSGHSIVADGPIGAAGAYQQLILTNNPTYGTKTTASGANASADAGIRLDATIRNGATASGTALTLQTAANGTNAIQVLTNSVCELHQVQ